jgi:RHS repeat-associated protein
MVMIKKLLGAFAAFAVGLTALLAVAAPSEASFVSGLDLSFGSNPGWRPLVRAPGTVPVAGSAEVAVGATGRIVTLQEVQVGTGVTSHRRYELTAFQATGQVDPTFGFNGAGDIHPYPNGVTAGFAVITKPTRPTVLSDNSVLLCGESRRRSATEVIPGTSVLRLLPNGSRDPAMDGGFGLTLDGGACLDMKVAPDGSVYVALLRAAPWRFFLRFAKLTPTMQLDTTFGTAGYVDTFEDDWHFQGMEVQPDNKLLVLFSDDSGLAGEWGDSSLARYMPNGAVDTQLPVELYSQHLGIAGDGRIVTVAEVGRWTGGRLWCRVTYRNADGTPDVVRASVDLPGYGCEPPKVSPTGAVYSLSSNRISRVNPVGVLDPNFGATEFDGPAFITGNGASVGKLAVDSQDRLMVTTASSTVDGNLFRMNPGGPVKYSFDIESLLGSQAWQERVADPVDTATGNFYTSGVDIDDVGIGMSMTRAYNGLAITTGPLGERWSFGVGPRLEMKSDRVDVVHPDATRFRFFAAGGGTFLRANGLKGALEADAGAVLSPASGTFPMLKLVHDNGLVQRFDSLGRFVSQTDWDGQQATATYDTAGRLASLTNSVASSMTFGYDASGRLATVTTASGKSVKYEYNPAGLLWKFTDIYGSITTYGYTGGGLLKTITDPTGVVTITNEYDPVGRVQRQTNAYGGVTTYAYDDSTRVTTISDSVANTTLAYSHDIEGKVLSISDPLGRTVTRGYDAANNLTSGTARDGGQSIATHDAKSNVKTVTEPEIGTTTYDYDDLNRVRSILDPWGKTTLYAYDAGERLPSSITDPTGGITLYNIVDGLVMSVTDPDGVVTAYTYTTRRQIKTATNAAGNITAYGYDGKGRLRTVTTPRNTISKTDYNVLGRVDVVTAADGGITSYEYDLAGRVKKETDPAGAITANVYSPVTGLLTQTTAPDSGVTTFEYDGNGQVKSVKEPGVVTPQAIGVGELGRVTLTKDELARSTTFGYDEDGRLRTSTAPDTGVVTTEYNDAGQVTTKTDEEGRVTTTAYDTHGRVDWVASPDNRTTRYTYDDAGRVKTVTDPRGGVTTNTYTLAGRLKSVVDATGLTTSYTYDPSGRLKKITSPGLRETRYTYTADSQVETITSPEGLITTYGYDPVGRVKSITDPAGVVTLRTWTKRGELETERIGDSGTVSYVYHPAGTLKSVTDALGSITRFDYDLRRNLRFRTNALNGVDEWTWTDADQVQTAKDPLGRLTSYTYDPSGRLQTMTDPAGLKATYAYFKDGRVKQAAWLNGATTNYTYKPAGEIATMNDGAGDWTYGYDTNGALASQKSPDGRITRWLYDSAGRRTRLIYPDGTSVNYSYDSVTGELKTITAGEVMADTFTQSSGTLDATKWTVTPVSGATATVSANALVAGWPNTAGAAISVNSTSAASADHEVSLNYRFPQTATNTATLSVAVKVSATSQVRVQIAAGATTGTFQQITSASPTPVALGTFPVPGGTGTTGLRLRLVGTSLKARTWSTTVAEPATWTTGAAVTGVTASGTAGITVARTAGAGTVVIDDFRQTDPTTAPTPLAAYTYNRDGQVTNEALLGGSRGYGIDKGRLISFTESLPGLSRSTSLTYDTTGRLQTETTGGVVTTFGYDLASQLKSVTPTGGVASSWSYDAIGRRTVETIGGTTTRSVYDAASQLCWSTTGALPATPSCATPPTGASTFVHDNGGRRTKEANPTATLTYGYDRAGRLTSLSRVTGGVTTAQTRAYDPNNRLMSTTAAGTTRRYDWDVSGGAEASLLTMSTPAGIQRNLIDGPAGWVAARSGPTSATIGTDVYGSVLNTSSLTDLARGTGYSAWGAPTGGTMSFNPTLGYRGELTLDAVTHLRAREYHTATGLFTSRDPMPGVPGTTTLANPYHYVNNSPLQGVDPTGMFAIGDENFGVGMMPTPSNWMAKFGPVAGALIGNVCAVSLGVASGSTNGFCQGLGDKIGSTLSAMTPQDLIMITIGFVPGADCVIAGAKALRGDGIDGFAVAGCVADIATLGAGGMLADLGKAGKRVDNLVDGTKHVDDLADANHWIDRAITVGACHSFDPSTEVVMADGTLRQIGDVAVGDQVIAIDPTSGQSSSREVSVVWRHIDDNLATLNVELPDGSTSTVDTTTTHPFWVLSAGWVNAGDLDAGDLLSSPDGQVKVLNVDERDDSAEMVDLTVEGVHTYQVAIDDVPVLVHNNNKDELCDLATNTGSPHLGPEDVAGKTRTEIRQLANDKGLVPAGQPDPIDGLTRRWQDPVTNKQRLRLDRGHVDDFGQPYANPRAAVDHCHLYTSVGSAVVDVATGDKHFPTGGC